LEATDTPCARAALWISVIRPSASAELRNGGNRIGQPGKLPPAAWTIVDVSHAAAALRWARLRTSSATTPNPSPELLARAASTAAFRARMKALTN
jgi:hypothetical protein